ncbi:MAG: GntR family transcriptional regulator, partial [Propionibacterium acidifaciens]
MFALDSTSIRSARQLVHLIEDAIATGQCQPGERLPAVRELASLADLSPVTVSAAIRDLRQRGLLVTEGRRGTFVSTARAHPPSRLTIDRPAESVDLSSGHPDYTLLPALHDTPVSLPARPDSATRLAELEELFRQGFAADDVTAEHIVFTHGAMEAVGGLLRSALSQGDAVAVEDPGYPHAHLLVDLLG